MRKAAIYSRRIRFINCIQYHFFCLQCIDAGCLGIHPADQHPQCRHYTFGSNLAEEHQFCTSVLCCIAGTYLLELLSVDWKLLLPLYYQPSVHCKGLQYFILTLILFPFFPSLCLRVKATEAIC